MKINLSQLEANPFRKISKYPIDREKVKQLKTSIEETTFWDNILARPHPTKKGILQMAYGHHRWIALKELKVKTVDIPVRSLDDAAMIRIMASENLDTWRASPAVVNETVLTTKEFLDAELKKCDSWDRVNKSIKTMFKSNSEYQNCRKNGVGQTTILKFLGKSWKQSEIQFALEILKDDSVDREAVESFKNRYQATEFRVAVKEAKIPVRSQKEVAKKIKSKVNGGRAIREEVFKHSLLPISKTKKSVPKELPMLDDFIEDMIRKISDLHGDFVKVKGHLSQIQSSDVKEAFEDISKELLTEMKQTFGG